MVSWRIIHYKIFLLIIFLFIQGLAISQSIIRGPFLQKATSTSMLVRWYTDVSVDSKVTYGTDPGNLEFETPLTSPTTNHSVQLKDLTP